jgi:hypothetical protein
LVKKSKKWARNKGLLLNLKAKPAQHMAMQTRRLSQILTSKGGSQLGFAKLNETQAQNSELV